MATFLFNEIEATESSTKETDGENMEMEVPDNCPVAKCEDEGEEFCGCEFSRCRMFRNICELNRFNECHHRGMFY